jgi:beta-mannosidase
MVKHFGWLLSGLFVCCLVTGCSLFHGGENVTALSSQGIATLSQGWQLQDIAKVPEGGDAISQPSYTARGWYKATVPGTVLTTLVNNGVYPEPLFGENNRPDKIPESLCRTSYWYRTQFLVPSAYAGKHVWLNFEGINYTAAVWVNGKSAGMIKGAFSRGIFDVTPFVEPGKLAAIAVKIDPPPHPGNPREQTAANGTGGNGGALAEDGPTFIASVGWDWIPAIRDRTMGIWQKVTLSSSGPVTIGDPLVRTDLPLPRTDIADISIETSVENLTDSPQSGVLRGLIGKEAGFSIPLTLAPHEIKPIKLDPQNAPTLRLKNPRLWWPNGYGEPNLYALHMTFESGDAVSNARDVTFGIRKITYDVPDSQNLTVSVNGVRVFCKGGNWGMDEAMKRIPRERLETQIRLHRDANYTMIRNWVGQSTSEDFYDLCDRYGIMIWDEFFQPNQSDGPNPTDIDTYLANCREKIIRFRNHPSIAIWCGRNESNPAPAAVAEGLQKLMAELDPGRTYHANSNEGRGVRSGGPYSWVQPQRYYAAATPARGGAIPNTAPATAPTTGRGAARGTGARGPGGRGGAVNDSFKTEIGLVSIPTLEGVKAMLDPKDWEAIDNDAWAEHDLCRGAQEGRGNSPIYSEMITQRYGKWQNLADFVRKAQMMNYESHRALYEGRFARLFTPNAGVLLWMSNPAQPSFVWQIYSHDLETFASFYATKKACEPVHIQMNQSDFHVMVINHTPADLPGLRASIRVFNLDGSIKHQEVRSGISAKASAATDAGAIEFPEGLSPVHFVKVELRNAQDQLISDNFYWRGTQQDELAALDTIPTVQLNASIFRRDSNGECILDVTLTNPTNAIAVMAHVQLRREKENVRVLPAFYTDNYVSLLPGESRTIIVEASLKDLNGQRPLITLDGWNVTTKSQSFPGMSGGASVAENVDARVNRPASQQVTTLSP